MTRLILIAAAMLAVAPAAIAQSASPAPAKKGAPAANRMLTLDQIRKLVAIRTPDAVIAQEIRTRGVSGDFTRGDLAEFRRQGAGSLTIAALTEAIPVASLTIRTRPGATVSLDGALNATNPDGSAIFAGIEPGRHRVEVRKPDFVPVSHSVELRGRQSLSLDIPIEWAVGFLTVACDAPQSVIQVGEVVHKPGNRVSLPVGFALVTASAPFHQPATQRVAIEPGKEANLTLSLQIDPDAVRKVKEQAHTFFAAGNYAAVLERTKALLQLHLADGVVLADAAMSFLELGNYDAFRSTAIQAIKAGAAIQIPVLHHHLTFGAPGGNTFHPVNLILNAMTLKFVPLARCNQAELEIPITELTLGGRYQKMDERAFGLTFKDPNHPKKNVTLNVYPAKGTNASEIDPSDNKARAIRAVLQTMMREAPG